MMFIFRQHLKYDEVYFETNFTTRCSLFLGNLYKTMKFILRQYLQFDKVYFEKFILRQYLQFDKVYFETTFTKR